MDVVKIFTNHTYYSGADAANASMTVGELIEHLQHFPQDTKVIMSNDGGYTYGYVNRSSVDEGYVRDKDEE